MKSQYYEWGCSREEAQAVRAAKSSKFGKGKL